jgi:hypothetical protein
MVEYNTSTNPMEDGVVRDTSGRGLDGVLYGGAVYDATQKAFVFTGGDQHITTNMNNKGDTDVSISFWIKRTADTDPVQTVVTLGTITAGKSLAFDIYDDGANIYWWTSGGENLQDVNGALQFPIGKWVHVTGTRTGGIAGYKLYINGVDWTPNMTQSTGTALTLPDNAQVTIGSRNDGTTYNTEGNISNFKLYDTVLTAGEVKTLYDMGRCDEGHHTTTVSRSQLRMGGENLVIEPCIKGFYEEGTWSPIMGGQSGGQKTPTSSNRGWFVRIGNLVTIGGTLAWNSTDTISGNPILAGLPYKATSDAGGRCVLGMGVTPNGFATPSHCTTMRMIIDPNNQFAYIIASDDQNAVSYTHSVTISNAGLLYGLGGTYKI